MRWFLPLFLVGCGTLSGARPLEPGQHEVGVVFGGPMIEFGGAPVPLPNLVVAGRSGLGRVADRPLDLGYGLNVTGLPFGIVSLQGDVGWLLADQAGARPAFTVRNGVFFATNPFGSDKHPDAAIGVWAADELELLASWKAKENTVWLGLSQTTDFTAPSLLLTPSIGASLDPGKAGGPRVQAEVSWYGFHRTTGLRTVQFVPDRPGAIGVHLGFATGFGKAR